MIGSAGHAEDKTKTVTPSDSYDEVYARYLSQARLPPRRVPDPFGWMNILGSDSRARHLNDLITIRVEESITASGTADASTSKATNTSIGVPVCSA